MGMWLNFSPLGTCKCCIIKSKLTLNFCHDEYLYVLHSSPFFFILLTCSIPVVSIIIFSIRVENAVDPDQMASDEAI